MGRDSSIPLSDRLWAPAPVSPVTRITERDVTRTGENGLTA
jgi:hypothetical protein